MITAPLKAAEQAHTEPTRTGKWLNPLQDFKFLFCILTLLFKPTKCQYCHGSQQLSTGQFSEEWKLTTPDRVVFCNVRALMLVWRRSRKWHNVSSDFKHISRKLGRSYVKLQNRKRCTTLSEITVGEVVIVICGRNQSEDRAETF